MVSLHFCNASNKVSHNLFARERGKRGLEMAVTEYAELKCDALSLGNLGSDLVTYDRVLSHALMFHILFVTQMQTVPFKVCR